MFDGDHYEVRQKIRLGNKYRIYEGEEAILESAQKKFRLKEDFRFTDPDTGEERFRVKAGSILDIASAYDVVDSETDERIGSVRRSVMSFFKHEYELLGPDGDVVATVTEDSALMALARRHVTTLIPFNYDIVSPSGEKLGDVSESFSVRDTYSIDVTGDLDPRLAVVGMVVIDAIEEN
ncbi:hypothetical protein NDI76_14505 [Halogeometricum sp. S1BR25-6]|uniref:LURP-one-related family protein n=1 Tax=Halogeometricum salsisoli TaxID=2950536 RepID=A0ABU2GGL2_9EURY|nr:hypothetical protein [Halogeometricum sp. S1BR25-6]MDS0299956.1 hypothetical protein [Halogeometricum sp. S1BR25-6]